MEFSDRFSNAQTESRVSFTFGGVLQQTSTRPLLNVYSHSDGNIHLHNTNLRLKLSNDRRNNRTNKIPKHKRSPSHKQRNRQPNPRPNILFNAGTYYLTRSIVDAGQDNIGLYFDNGAKFICSNNMNNPAVSLTSVNNWTIKDVTIDGNAANQANAAGTGGAAMGEEGIYVNIGSNHHITGAHITNVGQVGVMIVNFDSGHPSIGNIIENSVITNFGWNGITFYGPYIHNNFAINNEIAYGSDVGISTYGANDIIIGNYIHDMNGTSRLQ